MVLRLLIIVLLLQTVAACVPPTRSEGLTIEDQVVDGMTISLALASSPRANEATRTQVLLLDDQGQLITGALVTLALAAPDSTTTSIALDEVPQGGYERNDVVFSTAGTWILTITANVDGREHQATFTRDVEE